MLLIIVGPLRGHLEDGRYVPRVVYNTQVKGRVVGAGHSPISSDLAWLILVAR